MRSLKLPLFIALAFAILVTALSLVAIARLTDTAEATHLPLPEVGIDPVTSGNTATSLGPNEGCREVEVGETFDVDVYVKGVPPKNATFGGNEHGIAGFETDLIYDSTLLRVESVNLNYILAATGTSLLLSFTDPVPDADGRFLLAVTDLTTNYESGDGVVARVTFAALSDGLTNLTLSKYGGTAPPIVVDAATYIAYGISEVVGAEIRVGEDCPGATPGPDPTATPQPTTGIIGGEIKDNQGNLIPFSTVIFSHPSCVECPVVAVSASGGRFQVELPPGDYVVKAIAEIYVEDCWTNDGGSQRCATYDVISLGAGERVEDVDFNLGRLTQIRGFITDANGVPLEGVQLTTSPLNGGRSKEDGSYAAFAADGQVTLHAGSGEYVPEYWTPNGGTPDVSEATTFEIVNGTDQVYEGVNFVLLRRGTISGTVMDSTGVYLEGWVHAYLSPCAGPCRAQSSARIDSGEYVIENLLPGNYVLQADLNYPLDDLVWTANGGSIYREAAQIVSVAAEETLTDTDFIVRPTGTISGQIYDSSGNVAPDASIRAEGPSCPCSTTLFSSSGFHLHGLAAGEYTLRVDTPGFPTHYWTLDGGSSFARHASKVQVDEQQETFVNFRLRTTECANDANGDGRVSIMDLARVLTRLGARPGDARWLARSDLDGNGVVGFGDLWRVVVSYVRGECRPPAPA